MAREVVLRFVGDAGQLNRTFQQVDSTAGATMASLQSKVSSASSTMASKFSSMGTSLAAAGATMRRSGARLTRNVALPLAAIGGLGLKTAIDYERNMNILQQASGASGAEMSRLGQLAMALGADIKLPGTSAADAVEAMLELSRAGLTVADTMAATKGVLQLSAASGMSNADAALTAANALNAFHLAGGQAARVVDLLAGAAGTTNASLEDMAGGMKTGGGVFAAANIPIEDFVTTLGLMARAGYAGDDAGTSLKSMLLKLQNPSKEASGWMRDFGVNVYDAHGKMKPLRALIADFTSKTKGLSEEQRNAGLATIFGTDAVRSANAVLLAGAPAFDAMKAAVSKEGSAAAQSAAKNKGLGGALDGLKSAMETLALKVLVPALPVLTRFVTSLANFIPKIQSLPKPVLIAAAAFAGILVALGPLSFVFGALLSPLGLVVGALALVGGAIWAALNPEKAGSLMDKFKAKWNEMAPGILAALSRMWETARAWIVTNGPIIAAQMASWAKAFIGWVAPMIPPFLAELGHILAAIGTWLLDTAVPWLADRLANDWIPAFVGWVVKVTPGLLIELGKMLLDLLNWIETEAAPKIAAALAKLAISIPAGLINAVPGGKAVTGAVGKGADVVGGAVGAGAKGVGGAVSGSLGSAGKGFLGLAQGGLLLGVNRPTPLLVGEGHGREDVLAVPHSKGGIGGMGGGFQQTNHYHGVSLEEAATRSERSLAWRLALSGRR